MKHLLAASALFGLSVLANACGTDVDATDRSQFTTGNVQYTVYVYDAITGASLDGATVTVQISGDTLTSTKVGDAYLVEDVPGSTFPVTISADGYLPLTGLVTFSGASLTSFASPVFQTQYAQMYPTQSVAADQTIRVAEATDGTYITSGQVLAVLSTITSTAGSPLGGSATLFTGSYGFFPQVISVNISGGTATIPRDQLVYGGTYNLSIIGVQNSEGAYLTATSSFKAGTTPSPVVMFASQTGIVPQALTASNENGHVTAAGTLTLTFPYAVETCNTTSADWTYTSTASPDYGPPASDIAVKITASNANTQIVIAPITTGTDDSTTYPSLSFTYSQIYFRVQGNPTCTVLNGISLRGSGSVSPTVVLR